MKTRKIKETLCIFTLALCLVGNTFASDGSSVGDNSIYGVLNAVSDYVLQLIGGGPCEGRLCTTCKPGMDENGCRPPQN